MALVLDSGALIAVERRDRRIGALLRSAQQDALPVVTSAGAVAQVWRDGARQAGLARVLAGIRVVPLDRTAGSRVGELLRLSQTSDVVDAHVALLVTASDHLVTSDEDDLRHLLAVRGVHAAVVRVLIRARSQRQARER